MDTRKVLAPLQVVKSGTGYGMVGMLSKQLHLLNENADDVKHGARWSQKTLGVYSVVVHRRSASETFGVFLFFGQLVRRTLNSPGSPPKVFRAD